MLDLAILGLLLDGARHGYELRRQLAEYGFRSVSFGSVYPALRRLERRGLIESAGEAGRRKSYAVTPEGRAEFAAIMADESADADDQRGFEMRLAFFRYLDREGRIEVLERRRAALIQRLARTRASLKRRGRARVRMDRYTLALLERGMQAAEADIAWLDGMIESERAPRRRRRRPSGAAGEAAS